MTILDTLLAIDTTDLAIRALRSENAHLHACVTQDAVLIDNCLQVIAEQGNEIYRLRQELAAIEERLLDFEEPA